MRSSSSRRWVATWPFSFLVASAAVLAKVVARKPWNEAEAAAPRKEGLIDECIDLLSAEECRQLDCRLHEHWELCPDSCGFCGSCDRGLEACLHVDPEVHNRASKKNCTEAVLRTKGDSPSMVASLHCDTQTFCCAPNISMVFRRVLEQSVGVEGKLKKRSVRQHYNCYCGGVGEESTRFPWIE